MDTKFTPGPWATYKAASWPNLTGIESLDKETIDESNEIVLSPVSILNADAHLLAAAPELYEALVAARSQLKTIGTPDDAVNNKILDVCAAALAKACGENQ